MANAKDATVARAHKTVPKSAWSNVVVHNVIQANTPVNTRKNMMSRKIGEMYIVVHPFYSMNKLIYYIVNIYPCQDSVSIFYNSYTKLKPTKYCGICLVVLSNYIQMA